MKRAMWILWPSFLVGGMAEGIFFSMLDPSDLNLFGQPLELSRNAIYTIGFFLFWALGALSSALTCWLQQGANAAGATDG